MKNLQSNPRRRAVITQPTFLPWLGYFEQISQADVFVFLDSVQFERRSWQCRNRILDSRGQPFWLTVPLKAQPRETLIHEIVISEDQKGWAERHLQSISTHLGKGPHFPTMWELIHPILSDPPTHLVDLNIALIRSISGYLDLAPLFLRSSELPVTGRKSDLIIDILQAVGATDYYSSAGSYSYLENSKDRFKDLGISCNYQQWEHPVYTQNPGGFTSHLSAIDALSFVSREDILEMFTPRK